MAALTPVSKTTSNALLTFAACSGGGDTMDNTLGPVTLFVTNADSSPHSITIASQIATAFVPAGTAKTDLTVVVTNGKTAIIGPLDPAVWANASNLVTLTYTAVTSMSIVGVVPH